MSTTTGASYRIELKYLLREGYIRKGQRITGSLSWSNGVGEKTSIISLETCYLPGASYLPGEDHYLRLFYTLTTATGEKYEYDYKVRLQEIPSNLGRGSVLYFVCPASGKLCRILYRAYGSHIFKAREAYENRIYYSEQLYPETDLYDKEKKVEALWRMRRTSTYKGRPTKRALRIEKLNKIIEEEEIRRASPYYYLSNKMRRLYKKYGG